VWLAEETASGLRGRVAVRVGRPEALEGPLLRAIESLSRVRSSHVAIYHYCPGLRTADGMCAVVADYTPGVPLASVLANQPGCRLPWRLPPAARAGLSGSSTVTSAGGVIMGVLNGLAALHVEDPPIVHRGVTPSNIIVVNGSAVLTDIRLSALAGGPACLDGGQPSSCGVLRRCAAGAGGYISPELAEGTVGLEGLDARADVWAVGVVLHEALSGERLFPQAGTLHTQGITHLHDHIEAVIRAFIFTSFGLALTASSCVKFLNSEVDSRPLTQEDAMELTQKISAYFFEPPLLWPGEAKVPGLNQVLRRMLATDRAVRYSNAVAAAEAMNWVAREADVDLCRAMLERRVVPAMRALFLRHWIEKEGSPWTDTPECGQCYLEREVKLNRKAGNWLTRERLAAGDSGAWDATALCTILLWSHVHPLKADEAPEDHADVMRFREWRNEMAHGIVWDTDKASRCIAVMWAFIGRHQPSGA
jgi:serine/threonine protein kinase